MAFVNEVMYELWFVGFNVMWAWWLYEVIHEIEMTSWYEFNMRYERVGINVTW